MLIVPSELWQTQPGFGTFTPHSIFLKQPVWNVLEHVAHDTGLEDPFNVLVHREHVVEDGRLHAMKEVIEDDKLKNV